MQIMKRWVSCIAIALGILACATAAGAQVAYINLGQKALGMSAAYESGSRHSAWGTQIMFSDDGRVGAGLLYSRDITSKFNAIGALMEGGLLKAGPDLPIGFSVLGSVAYTWRTVKGNYSYLSEVLYSGTSIVVGGVLYGRALWNSGGVQPFVQFTRTFARISVENYSQSTAANTVAAGVDLILGGPGKSFSVVLTPGAIINEDYTDFGLTLTYVRALN